MQFVCECYGNVAGLDEQAYKAMPRVEQTLASYLSPGTASSLKAPTIPSKPLHTTSSLLGKGYSATGQAGACLHTMSLLQAYQADLLKGLADGEKVDLEEPRRTVDLALHATKETAPGSGAVYGSHGGGGEAPVPSGLFGKAVNSVVSRYQEARKQAAAFQRYLPRRSLTSAAAGHEQPQPSTRSSYREVQKLSVATCAPPSRDRDSRHSRPGSSKARPDLRVEVSLLSLPALQGTTASDRAHSGTGTLVNPTGGL
ncbi:Zinc finger protein zas1 [Labeo rohita]|uniref:Zinc finger protein zas1 n=1 Tax=Labeo rohita TaxID=84645 RepID=A0ABQ8L3G1_LABRO|nr:Zinc finger protein zas1 [Labeo rohita]